MEARQGSRFAALNAELAERIDHLLERVTVAAGGNPGLHALLNRLTRQHASLHLADAAIAEVERYHLVHALPEQGEVGEFFRQLGLVTYLRALTSDELAQMRAALVFYPAQVPWAVMEAVGHAAGVDQPAAAMKRLLGLGCLDAFHSPGQAARDAPPKVAVNALAKPLYPPLTAAEDAHLDVKGALDAWYRQLPAFGTGHEHERTKGLGEIADFLFTRGELDDALQLQVEERLPLVLCLEDPIATCEIHLSCAAIRIAQGRMNEAMSHQATQDGLAAAIDLAKKLGYIHVASIVKVVKLLEQPAMAGTAVSYLHNAARHFRALESPRGRSGAAMSADSVRSTK